MHENDGSNLGEIFLSLKDREGDNNETNMLDTELFVNPNYL
jgi:hypothetical protein